MSYRDEIKKQPGAQLLPWQVFDALSRADAEIAALQTDAERWRFLMTEPDGFDMSVREYDDDGDEHWISCYPAAELQEKIDAARGME